jgi:hypothetical protein
MQHKLEKLFAESFLLNMVVTGLTVLGHKVFEGQDHMIQKFVKNGWWGHGQRTLQPANPNGPSCGTPLFNTPELEPCACEEMLMCNVVQRPLLGYSLILA